ncbi:MAG TPA: ThuA domain-containing protein [Kiritimatiellia bacterium]|nr:ThuA domain-containing protein [Kiritimatiellia bacterium]HRU71236.1 ThuA domain-containing protein [Kiritimatiellia bacterium]
MDVLIYTRNYTPDGKGFVHDNIATSVAALSELCTTHGLKAEASDDPALFTEDRLKGLKAVIFANSNNEAFATDAQRGALLDYVYRGGAFMGLHSATGSDRKSEAFRRLLGGRFLWHPPLQPFSMRVNDRRHPATAHLDATWAWADEAYVCDYAPDIHVLVEIEIDSLQKKPFDKRLAHFRNGRFPLAWCRCHGAGRVFYTALGHLKTHYQDQAFRTHLIQGLRWAMDVNA